MTTRERIVQMLLTMTEEQIARFTDLMNRFNWDVQAALEYLQNGGKA